MVSFAASIRMSPIGITLMVIATTSVIFYFRDIIKESNPMRKLSHFGEILKSQGYNAVGFHIDEVSLKQLLAASIKIAQLGGNEVRQVREKGSLQEKSKGKTDEGVNDPVTQGDLLSHRAMYDKMKELWPGITIISEEKDKNSYLKDTNLISSLPTNELDRWLKDKNDEIVPMKDVVIWIDPLDATKEYSENLRKYVTTMVCVAIQGKPVIGVIHKPFSDETFWGWYQHGHNINLNSYKDHREFPWIIVSRSHAGNINKTAKRAFGQDVKVIPAGGAGYKVLELATSKVDVYLHITKIKKWDICAGDAILRSVSGKMTDLMGNDITYDMKDNEVLEHGLLATMKDHNLYHKKLVTLKQTNISKS